MKESQKYRRKKNIVLKGGQPLLSVQDISEKYHFDSQTVRNWINRDGLKHEGGGHGKKFFISQKVVEAFIKKWYSI